MLNEIRKLEIKNFRNIINAEYNLSNRVAFSGKNFIGKSNCLQSIHWLLTSYLLDGSQDIQSIKPLDDSKKDVRVKVTFNDDTVIEKVYKENWVKPFGSEELVLQGNTTSYYINNVECNRNTDAYEFIKKEMGLDKVDIKSKIDLVRMLINPFYLVEQVDWKVLRNFILELVGDISDDDVINTSQKFNVLKSILVKYQSKSDLVASFYKSQIKNVKNEIFKCDVLIDELSKVNDVDKNELEKAKKQIALLNQKLGELNLARAIQKNPKINEIELEISNLNNKKNTLIEHERLIYDENVKEITKLIDVESKKKDEVKDKINKLKLEKVEHASKLYNLRVQIKAVSDEITKIKEYISILKDEFEITIKQDFTPWSIPSEDNCPNCGYLLNKKSLEHAKDQLNKARTDYELNKSLFIKKINKEVEEQLRLIKDKNDLLAKINDEYNILKNQSGNDDKLTQLEKILSGIEYNVINYQNRIDTFRYSDEVNELINQINELKRLLDIESKVNVTITIDEQIKSVVEEKFKCQELISKHEYFINICNQLNNIKNKKRNFESELNKHEEMLLLVDEFVKTKLDLLNQNIASVFGIIKFNLIENNIKEGSYNEVCYPLIIHKFTPYQNGSHSEKIITGVAIIEAIRKYLNLPFLPIIFDEAESLDSYSVVNHLNTDSQIITAKVDDRFSDITLLNI